MKIHKSVTFNGCSVYLLNSNLSVIASFYFLFKPEVHCRKQQMRINCCNEEVKRTLQANSTTDC